MTEPQELDRSEDLLGVPEMDYKPPCYDDTIPVDEPEPEQKTILPYEFELNPILPTYNEVDFEKYEARQEYYMKTGEEFEPQMKVSSSKGS